MNSRLIQLRTIPSFLKFSIKTKFTQILPTYQIFHRSHFFALSSQATFTTAAKRPNESSITVHLPQTGESVFPTNWLRDNCQCPQCFHQDTQSRIIHLLTFDPNVTPKHITIKDNILSITWEDEHRSCYSFDWLAERSFSPQAQEKWLTQVYRTPKVPWTAKDFNDILLKTSFDNVMNNDQQLKTWLEKLSTYGVAVVTETPGELACVRQLAKRVAFIRRTHYGEEFSVKAKPGTTNVAYLSANLQLHTDLPYYHYKPGEGCSRNHTWGVTHILNNYRTLETSLRCFDVTEEAVNLLHCLVQASGKGGENLLTDVSAVAEEFRKNDPERFSALTTTVVDWNDVGQEDGNYFHKIHREPVISLDRWGKVERINFSQPQRDSHFSVPIEQVTPWYDAMQKFVAALHSPKFCVKYKMAPGEILTFDNTRLVHGRSAYEESTNRHVVGAYLDWDEIRSRLRVLKKEFLRK